MSFEDSDIYQAILDGDMAALGCSLAEQQDVNLRDCSGKSYLHICIELGQTDLVEYMAQRVFLGFRDDSGLTVLDLAARYRMEVVERQLVKRVAGMQDSDETQGMLQLFQSGWRAWPPLRPLEELEDGELPPGHRCQIHILEMQDQVDKIHWAVHGGQLDRLQEALTDESLALVSDYTGVPPLQKAVLFEWLSMVQYLSRGFPQALDHPDHMGRTALHYAAAYYEYQDNILYKQLVKAGANEDVRDLRGYKPEDYMRDASLLSIQQMREEVKWRLSRPPKDYSSRMSWEEIRSTPNGQQGPHSRRSMRRWRTITSVASFAHNNFRKVNRARTFEETELYECIITNNMAAARQVLGNPTTSYQAGQVGGSELHPEKGSQDNCGEPMTHIPRHSVEGFSYLHLAIAHHVSPHLLSLLLSHVSPAHRDCDGLNPLELALLTYKDTGLAEVLLNVILGVVLRGDVTALQGLAQDGWQYWPSEQYLSDVLQDDVITPQMTQFLHSVDQFVNDVIELHKAAILHQEPDQYQNQLLMTGESAVTCLNHVGLSLAHLCVIFYNIKLLTRLLHDFPFVANIKDSVGRTPLHYAAALDDDEYLYTLLRAAHSRDDEEDLWGQRPCDYITEKKRLVSPTIQETIRNKLHNPLCLKPEWPTCLLSARMEGSKVYEAIKANDVDSLKTLLKDASTDRTLRDAQGRGFLHNAVLTAAEPPVIKALLDGGVDIAVRDCEGNTALDLALAGPHKEAVQDTFEDFVKELLLGVEEEKAQALLMAGWSHWPVTAEEAKQKSEKAAELLAKITQLQEEVAKVHKATKEGDLVQDLDVKTLLDNKQLATAADFTGLPPLHKAVLYQQEAVVNFFIKDFKDTIAAKDNMGRTALHYAAVVGDEDKLYGILKAAGADETTKDLVGKTPEDYKTQPADLPIDKIKKRIEDALTKETRAPTPKETAEDKEDKEQKSDDHAETKTTEAVKQDEKSKETKKKAEPPKPVTVTPVNMYVAQQPCSREPPPSTVDGKYIHQHLGAALTVALAEIAEKRPWDPIEYLGQWLRNYRKNMDEYEKQNQLLEQIRAEENAANEENLSKFKREEEHKRLQEEERRKKEEAEAERKRKEEEEKQRQVKEAALAHRPGLPTVTEEEAEDSMFRERDEAGQTELHVLAAQSGSDLVALINLGYSLADRDTNNMTPRDVAEEKGIEENVEAIDNYVTNLLEQEKLETLNQLILDGYDKLDAVFEKVSTDGLPENATNFVKSIPQLQERVEATFKAVLSGVARDVENALERKTLALSKDKYGRSPLHLALLANHMDIARNIAENFPQAIKTRDNLNRTPLHYAAALSEEMFEFLKTHGADVNEKDARKHAPAYYKDQKEEILKLKENLPTVTATAEHVVPEETKPDNEQPKESSADKDEKEKQPSDEEATAEK